MFEPITARYEWNPEAMAEALAIHQRLRFGIAGRIGVGVLVAVYLILTLGIPLAVVAILQNTPEVRRGAIVALAVIGALWVAGFAAVRRKVFLKWTARRAFGSLPKAAYFVEWSIDEDQLANRTVISATTFLWPAFIKAVEAPYGFLIYQNKNFFNTLPAHGFASAESVRRFAELARSRVPNYVVLGECLFPSKPEPIGLDEF